MFVFQYILSHLCACLGEARGNNQLNAWLDLFEQAHTEWVGHINVICKKHMLKASWETWLKLIERSIFGCKRFTSKKLNHITIEAILKMINQNFSWQFFVNTCK